jgi:hypothetical protein
MALVYLIAWPVTLIGIVLIALSEQWAYAIFVPGVVTMTLWAIDLNNGDPEAGDRAALMPFGLKSWQVTWYRVVLGVELPRAWQTSKGNGPRTLGTDVLARHAPPKSRSGD